MSYEPYATPEYYTDTYGGTLILENDIERALQIASRHIDSLTYNRIVGRGFSSLTQFQRDIIQDVVCQQADFETENADEINSILQATASMVYPPSLAAAGTYSQTKVWR